MASGQHVGQSEGPLRLPNTAMIILMAILLAVAISPRIRLGGDMQVDVRLQDILLVPSVLYLMIKPGRKGQRPLRNLMSPMLTPFVLGALLVTLCSIVVMPEVPSIMRVAFLGRGLELFALAAVVAGLALRAGRNTTRNVLRVLYLGAFLNIGWVLYQAASGEYRTVIGLAVSEDIESYGPQLIGEPSAFGAGQYFAFVAALAAARIWSGHRRFIVHGAVIATAFVCTYFVESRISMGSIVLTVAILLVVGRRRGRVNILGFLLAVAAGVYALSIIVPQLSGRASIENVQAGLLVREDSIWGPLWDAFLSAPFLGVGPGGLVPPLRSEAHNIYLRAILDYGLIFGVVFILIFLVVLVRAIKLARLTTATQPLNVFAALAMFSITSTLVSGLVQDALTGVMSSHLTMISIGLFAVAWGFQKDRDRASIRTARSNTEVPTDGQPAPN